MIGGDTRSSKVLYFQIKFMFLNVIVQSYELKECFWQRIFDYYLNFNIVFVYQIIIEFGNSLLLGLFTEGLYCFGLRVVIVFGYHGSSCSATCCYSAW